MGWTCHFHLEILSIVKWLTAAMLWLGTFATGGSAEELPTGPLASRFKLTLEPGEREEVLGPLYYEENTPSREVTAVSPLWSRTDDLGTGFAEVDVLYPLFTYDRFGEEYRYQFFQVLSFFGGHASQTDTNFSRFTLFPFYFQQRSSVPEKNYTAVWPFYGHLKHRFFRSQIEFALWPAYVKTVRSARAAPEIQPDEFIAPVYRFFQVRRQNVTTYNFLAPLFHVRVGPGLTGWQAWPLIGAEHKKTMSWTNSWGEVQSEGGYEKFFALWPLFFKDRIGIGTTNEEHQLSVLPLFSSLRSPLRDSTTAPWPLGITYTVDRARRYREWGAPWPLVVFARGEGKTSSRIFPLFGFAHNESLESDFVLWPLYKYNRLHSAPVDRERSRILYFLYSDTIEKNTESGQARRRVDFWPFFTYKRDWDGNERWQSFSIFEPILPVSKSIERNYSQLWSVVRAERNAATGAHSESLFWNLYRHDSNPTNRHSSFLLGLVQWQVTPEGRKSRWFYLPANVSY
jgi:hypothetical protein